MGYRFKVIVLFVLCSLFFVQAKAQELLDYPLDTIKGEEVYRYEVERSIGLYRISVNFHVSQSEIVRLNPQLRERGVHYAELLYIPTGRKVDTSKPTSKPTVQPQKPVLTQPKRDTVYIHDTVYIREPIAMVDEPKVAKDTDTIPLIPDSLIFVDLPPLPNSFFLDSTPQKRVVEMALLLPFESQQTKRSGNADRMLEFYQGTLMALNDLQNDSTVYRLRVYDSERSERRVNALCDSTELDSVQGILGLVYPIQIERMSTWCESRQVPLLLPFADDIDLASHPQVLQFNSSALQEADSLCAWIIAHEANLHCVALDVNESDLTEPIRILLDRMEEDSIELSWISMEELMSDSAAWVLDSEKENLFILHSDRFQQVRILLPYIVKLQEAGYKVRIVSQYSWQKEHLNLPQVYTSVFTSDIGFEIYDAMWSEFFKNDHVSENPRYDLLGYDLMRALVAWLNGETETEGLQSIVRWAQVENGGYQNTCVKVIAY
jgi:hypothetical protein